MASLSLFTLHTTTHPLTYAYGRTQREHVPGVSTQAQNTNTQHKASASAIRVHFPLITARTQTHTCAALGFNLRRLKLDLNRGLPHAFCEPCARKRLDAQTRRTNPDPFLRSRRAASKTISTKKKKIFFDGLTQRGSYLSRTRNPARD